MPKLILQQQIELEQPQFEVDRATLTERYGKFQAEPLESGRALLLGRALRQSLLSEVEGSALVALKVEGAEHEFSVLEGVQEGVADLVLNLKNLRFRLQGSEPQVIELSAQREGEVHARDFSAHPRVEVLTPDVPIAHLDANGKLQLQVWLARGRGYLPRSDQAPEGYPAGTIMLDALFSPVLRVELDVKVVSQEHSPPRERLTLELRTDGSISPPDALAEALSHLRK